jgi:NAD(P)H-hydrate epimerase
MKQAGEPPSGLRPDPLAPEVLLTVEEMRAADRLAIERGAAGWDLMQAAGRAVAAEAQRRWDRRPALVLCGPGNNGGDGYVAAHELRRAGWPVRVALLGGAARLQGDAARAAALWNGPVEALEPAVLERAELVIDALFGAGLARPPEGAAAATIAAMNGRGMPCLAVDLPSGIDGDSGQILGAAVQAAATVTFFRRKPGHLLYPGRAMAGDVAVADIGIPAAVLGDIQPRQFENTPALWRHLLRKPRWDDNKYTRGQLLIAGGDIMTGAARLAARAARRVGTGMVATVCSRSAHGIYALDSAGVVTLIADSDAAFEQLLADGRRNAILIGPGHGGGAPTRARTLAVLRTGRAAVLDADALTCFADAPRELIDALHPNVVVTPHEGEFRRAFPDIPATVGKLARARLAARLSRATVLLKGADTVIAAPDGAAVINANAPAGLAVAGTGDVLAGIVGGLLAQKWPPAAAAAAAAWIHGLAAELAAGKEENSILPEDVIDKIGESKIGVFHNSMI